MVKLSLPIYWINEKKTKKSTTHLVGMNWYRNAHYFNQNKMKKDFHELVNNQLTNSDLSYKHFKVTYVIHYKNPSCDGSNIVALIEKFLLDSIQELNIVENDTVKQHLGSTWSVAGQDKENPRCEIFIEEV